MKQDYPKARQDYQVIRSGNEAVLCSPKGERVHVLNRTAQFIWDRLDGQHSIAEIIDQMSAAFIISPEIDLKADVEKSLDTFQRLGLLEGM